MSTGEIYAPYVTAIATYEKVVAALDLEKSEASECFEAQVAFAGICNVVAATPEHFAPYQHLATVVEDCVPDPQVRRGAFDGVRALELALNQTRRDLTTSKTKGHDFLHGQHRVKDGSWLLSQAKTFMTLFGSVIDGTWDSTPAPLPEKPVDSHLRSGEAMTDNTFEVIVDPEGTLSIDSVRMPFRNRQGILMRALIDAYRENPGHFITNDGLKNSPAWVEMIEHTGAETHAALSGALRTIKSKLVKANRGEFLEYDDSQTSRAYRLRIGSLTETDETLPPARTSGKRKTSPSSSPATPPSNVTPPPDPPEVQEEKALNTAPTEPIPEAHAPALTPDPKLGSRRKSIRTRQRARPPGSR